MFSLRCLHPFSSISPRLLNVVVQSIFLRLIVAHLVRNFSNGLSACSQDSLLEPLLNKMNLVYTISCHVFQIYCEIMFFHLNLGFPNGLLPLLFPTFFLTFVIFCTSSPLSRHITLDSVVITYDEECRW
jgi:hypothetical protein